MTFENLIPQRGGRIRRPMRSALLLVEFRLQVAADIERPALAQTLVDGATAGLYGLVAETLRCDLDGVPALEEASRAESVGVKRLHPLPDPRMVAAVMRSRRLQEQTEKALREIERLVDLPGPREQEGGAAVPADAS